MNSEEEFKNILSNLVESKEFPFEESEWEKARALIDAKKRGGRMPFFILGAVLLLGGVAGGYYYNSTPGEKTIAQNNITTVMPVKGPTANETVNEEISAAPAPVAPETETGEVNVVKTHKAHDNNKITADTKIPSESPAPEDNSEGHTPAVSSGNPVKSKAANESAGTAPVTEVHIGKNPTVINSNPKNNTASKSENTVTTITEDPASVQNQGAMNVAFKKKTKTPQEEGAAKTWPVASAVNEPLGEATNEKTITSKPAEEKPAVTEPVSSAPPVEEKTSISEVQGQPLPVAGAPGENKTVADSSAKIIVDSTLVAKPDTASKNLAEPVRQTMMLSLEAGGAYLGGWKNSDGKEASGFNPVIGLNYYYPLTNRLTVSIGAQYTSAGNLRAFSHTSKVTKYTTGEESKVTVITPEKLHYLVAPLKLNFALTGSDVIGAGINFSYLADVTSNMETYDLKLNQKENVKNTRVHGYTKGFKPFETQFSVFYRRHLYSGLYINTEIFMGATDIKDDEFFKSATKERNYGLKLTLVYRLFNRNALK